MPVWFPGSVGRWEANLDSHSAGLGASCIRVPIVVGNTRGSEVLAGITGIILPLRMG